MNKRPLLICICIISFLSSCDIQIDPSAANSASAIIATLGEYFYAFVTLLLVFVFSLFRGVGVGTALFGLLFLIIDREISLEPIYFLAIGLLLFAMSFVPIKQYIPQVNISRKKMSSRNTDNGMSVRDIIIQIAISIVTIIIEYAFFVN